MKIEIDLKKIARLSDQKENENLRYRTLVKFGELEDEELDAIVHKLNREISAAIDCRNCGNCCKTLGINVDEKDIQRLADHFIMDVDDFMRKYVEEDKDEGGYTFRNSPPCPFLIGKRCSVYSARPEACRSYPNLHREDFSRRTLSVIANCSVCPIAYNVWDELKQELREKESEAMIRDVLREDLCSD